MSTILTATPVTLIQPPEGLQPGSPEWWLYELERELNARWPLIAVYEDAFEGRYQLAFATSKYREAYAQMLAAVSDNWIPLVIGASVDRLRPQGFLFGKEKKGDQDAWDMWQRNNLDADAPLAFTEACKHGESYLLVWPDEDAPSTGVFGRWFSRRSDAVVPRITVEHPSQVVVRRIAGDRRRRAAALKKWRDDYGRTLATLYLPDRTLRYEAGEQGGWEPRRGVEAESPNPLGVVPMVPLVNDPQMLPCRPANALTCAPYNVPPDSYVGLGRSDQADAFGTVLQINKILSDLMVASEFAAYRQRWVIGLQTDDDEDGEPPFKVGIDRLLSIEANEQGDDIKVGEFEATDLENYTKALDNRVLSLASRTRTPPTYFPGPGLVNISDKALKTTETGHALKCEGKQSSYDEGLEESVRLGFAWMGDEARAMAFDAEVEWAPAEQRSEAEFVDSLVKKLSLGVPKEQLWRDAGYSPQEIARFQGMLLAEALINGPPPPPEEPPEEPNAGEPDQPPSD